MRIATIVLGIFLGSTAAADPIPWMKKENPDTLHFVAIADPNCGISTAQLTEMINAMLVDSQLRPGDYLSSTETFGFLVQVNCYDSDTGWTVYKADVNFVREFEDRILLEYPNYGSFGQGIFRHINDYVRRDVKKIITAYVQANSD